MATNYFIEKSDFGNFINFTDSDEGGTVNILTSQQIEVEYVGTPSTLTLNSSINGEIGNLILWKVVQLLHGMKNNSLAYNLASQNVKSQRILVTKKKNLHTSDITIKQWDY